MSTRPPPRTDTWPETPEQEVKRLRREVARLEVERDALMELLLRGDATRHDRTPDAA